MNILILSAGTRDKVVEAFRRELGGDGLVVATDASSLAPALYAADRACVVPRIDAPGYIDRVLDICDRERIDGVLSLIDPELSLIAGERERFEAIGVTPIVSSKELCDICLDKYRAAQLFTEHGLTTAVNYLDYAQYSSARDSGDPAASLPIFVKPRYGSASININKVSSERLLEAMLEDDPSLMLQEYMRGQEYGADVYIDLISGRCTHIFLKKKLKMRAGETDKSVSVKVPSLFRTISRFVEEAGFRGMIDIDLFHDEAKDVWYFSEVNPRFGGGYPHAYACGVNFPKAILTNLRGEETPVSIGDYEEGVCMMKYNDLRVLRARELSEGRMI